MRKIFFGLCLVGFLSLLVGVVFATSDHLKSDVKQAESFLPNDQRTRKIIEQEQLMRMGNEMVRQSRYEEAINKFKEAMNPELLLHDYDIEPPIFSIAKVLKLQRKYEEALRGIVETLEKHPDVHEGNWFDEKLELEALIKARDTNAAQPIYEHISYLKKKYEQQLPPKRVFAGISDIIASAIFRLYEHIGDYDAGMQFAETFLQFYAKRGPGNPYQAANPHFQIKQAFEADKAEGFKGCINAKPGEVCMGHATKALIESDYFPW